MAETILLPIYEPEFLGFSYGFRPGRGAHDALDALAYGIERRGVRWIVDADIRSYFDRINRDWLVRFEARIVERAFGLGPCALTEVMALLQNRPANAEA